LGPSASALSLLAVSPIYFAMNNLALFFVPGETAEESGLALAAALQFH
jgi:hypothetical protein